MLQPYDSWVRCGTVYFRDGERQLSALEDAILLTTHLALWPSGDLVSPAAIDARIAGIPYFQYFRSKEIWLDIVDTLAANPAP